MENKLVGLCGRKENGKTEIAKVFNEYGYEIMSFAKPLKILIANLLGKDVDYVNEKKLGGIEFVFKDMDITFLSKETSIPIKFIVEKVKDKIFTNTRDIMQYVGTDIIRAYNPNWHVETVSKMLEDGKKYVFDDVRFKNEAEFIKNNGGGLWFVTRPKLDNISNHESETNITWHDCGDKVIINNKDLEYIKFNCRVFLENGYDKSLSIRNKVMYEIYNNNYFDKITKINEKFNVLDALLIFKDFWTYNKKAVQRVKELGYVVERLEDKLKVRINNDEYWITNPLELEDLKEIL